MFDKHEYIKFLNSIFISNFNVYDIRDTDDYIQTPFVRIDKRDHMSTQRAVEIKTYGVLTRFTPKVVKEYIFKKLNKKFIIENRLHYLIIKRLDGKLSGLRIYTLTNIKTRDNVVDFTLVLARENKILLVASTGLRYDNYINLMDGEKELKSVKSLFKTFEQRLDGVLSEEEDLYGEE